MKMEFRSLLRETVKQAYLKGMELSEMQELLKEEYSIVERQVQDDEERDFHKMSKIFVDDLVCMYGEMTPDEKWISEEILVAARKYDDENKLWYEVARNTNCCEKDRLPARKELLDCLRKKFKVHDMDEIEALKKAVQVIERHYRIPKGALS